VKIGLVLPLFTGDADRVLAFAGHAEQRGFDGVFAFDHFFPPGASPDKPSLDAFATLAAVAAATSRIRIGTLVTRAALRPAGLLAKTVATIDDISGGRMIVGIGTGDSMSEREQQVFGLPIYRGNARRRHLSETVLALKALFRNESWPGGEFVPAMAGPLLPPTVTPGGPPIWIGGASENAVRNAAEIADGWNGWGLPADVFNERSRLLADNNPDVEATWSGLVLAGEDEDDITRLRHAREAENRLDKDLWSGTAAELSEYLTRLRDDGRATWAIMLVAGPADRVDLIADSVLPRVADAS
jgi:alkanesulfonate monooxygenase SsuD/methylene tetrahydromethanopterin reductase-like flavin-dependent oxidoreductase (luciferase family)